MKLVISGLLLSSLLLTGCSAPQQNCDDQGNCEPVQQQGGGWLSPFFGSFAGSMLGNHLSRPHYNNYGGGFSSNRTVHHVVHHYTPRRYSSYTRSYSRPGGGFRTYRSMPRMSSFRSSSFRSFRSR